jgi:hypothetical protein
MSLFSWIRQSADAYLAILSLHVVAIALFGGMVLLTDLRLLGVGMRSYSVPELLKGLRRPKRIGLALALGSGVVLFALQAERYASDPWFWTKMALLLLIGVHSLLFRRRVYNSPEHNDRRAKAAAGLSLLLWTGVICMGREPGTIKDIMHSMVDPNGDFVFQSVEEIADARGAHEKLPQTDAEWQDLRNHLAVLTEVPDLLQGRRAARLRDRSRNPGIESEPEEIQKAVEANRQDLMRRARRLQEAATGAIQAVDARNKEALSRSIDSIDKACESCHLHYWYPKDTRAREAAKQDGITDF